MLTLEPTACGSPWCRWSAGTALRRSSGFRRTADSAAARARRPPGAGRWSPSRRSSSPCRSVPRWPGQAPRRRRTGAGTVADRASARQVAAGRHRKAAIDQQLDGIGQRQRRPGGQQQEQQGQRDLPAVARHVGQQRAQWPQPARRLAGRQPGPDLRRSPRPLAGPNPASGEQSAQNSPGATEPEGAESEHRQQEAAAARLRVARVGECVPDPSSQPHATERSSPRRLDRLRAKTHSTGRKATVFSRVFIWIR
jgi:hypothetical protein